MNENAQSAALNDAPRRISRAWTTWDERQIGGCARDEFARAISATGVDPCDIANYLQRNVYRLKPVLHSLNLLAPDGAYEERQPTRPLKANRADDSE